MQSKLNLFLETGETYKEQLRGTIGYMSPELILTGGLLLYLCVYARVCTYDSCGAFSGSRYVPSLSRGIPVSSGNVQHVVVRVLRLLKRCFADHLLGCC
jgi:hypothetical protein